MTQQLNAAKWVNSIASQRQKPSKKQSYGKDNGNKNGAFLDEVIIVGDGKSLTVSAGSEYCVYAPMGGTGTAAAIFDPVHGQITIYRGGKVTRIEPHSSHTQTLGVARMNARLSIA